MNKIGFVILFFLIIVSKNCVAQEQEISVGVEIHTTANFFAIYNFDFKESHQYDGEIVVVNYNYPSGDGILYTPESSGNCEAWHPAKQNPQYLGRQVSVSDGRVNAKCFFKKIIREFYRVSYN